MDAARWERLQTLFHQALARPEKERAAFLEREAGDDPALLADVRAMLDEDAGATARGDGDSPLDRDLGVLAHGVLGEAPPLRTVGPYRVLGVLGRGGMGTVYLAERDDLGRRVAIKVLRDAALSPVRRERFEREEQVLAALTHPAIARLYDAHVLPDGTPYFVMEAVEGAPITGYCDTHDCSLGQRLRLFRAACEAVQHAHRQAVIHRDLKPSNIFVTEADGEPAVKLLDFGIAKPLESLDAPVDQTRDFRLLTPAYAAPEQMRGEPVGTYTDVYALGVVLYELLAGCHPFDLAGLSPAQVEARVVEGGPEPPSRRSCDDARSGVERSALGRQAWADLDVLCLTAMHEDPERRYPTVEALLRDLDRFRGGKPLDARPDSFGYRAGKFARRHRAPLAAAAVVVAVIVGLTAFYTARLAQARDAAVAEAARTQRIQQFVLDLLAGGDETVGPADSLRVLTLIERGVHEARVLDGEPDLQAELFQTLGGVYQGLGDLDRADSLLQAALAQRRALWGPDHPEVAPSLVALGLLRSDQGTYEEAEQLAREALAISRAHLPPTHPTVAEALMALGYVRQRRGDYDQAIDLLTRAVQLQARRGPSPALSNALGELANAHYYAGHYATSDSLNRVALALDAELFGTRHPYYATGLINLAGSQKELGYADEAERLYRQALALNLDYHGPDHPTVASNLSLLGGALLDQGRHDEAYETLDRALEARERFYGPDNYRVGLTLSKLGTVALERGEVDTAEALFTRELAIFRDAFGAEHPWVGAALSSLASAHAARGDLVRAETLLREAVALYTDAVGPDHVNTAVAQVKLGRTLVQQGRYAEAEPTLRSGYATLAAQASPTHPSLQQARAELAVVCDTLGHREDAERFRTEYATATSEARGG